MMKISFKPKGDRRERSTYTVIQRVKNKKILKTRTFLSRKMRKKKGKLNLNP